jgi:general stress protein 26
MKKNNQFKKKDLKEFEPSEKIGLLVTVTPEGLPHITLITSLQAKDEKTVIWGQFTEGESKLNVKHNTKVAFLILTMDKSLWRGTADYVTHAKEGDEYIMYNNQPMFRYNSYFGINTVHYMNLCKTGGRESLPMLKIIAASVMTKISKAKAKTGIDSRIMKVFGENIFNNFSALKFLAYIKKDGYPDIIPLIQCQAADSRRIVFSPLAYKKELKSIKKDSTIAMFCLNMSMESVLVRGKFLGFNPYRFIRLGVVDIDYVYNSMLPKHGQIYPEQKLEAVLQY